MKIGKITLDDEINRSIGDVISDGLSGVVIDELGTVIISGEFGTVVSRESVSAIIRIKGLVVQIDVSTDVDNNDGVNSVLLIEFRILPYFLIFVIVYA